MKRAGLFVLLAALAVLPAGADVEPDRPSILGSWSFKSWTYDDCDFGGVARFTPGEAPSRYRCELTARQACMEVTWVVRQSCVADRTGDRLTIRSSIEEFLQGEPTPLYWPDNFVLTIQSSDRMTGTLVSHGSHPSEFVRTAEGIS